MEAAITLEAIAFFSLSIYQYSIYIQLLMILCVSDYFCFF